MCLRSLRLMFEMDGVLVERSLGLSTDTTILTKDHLAELLSDLIVRSMTEKPDIVHGMIANLLDNVEKRRRAKIP